MTNYLLVNTKIVTNPEFENAIIKVLNNDLVSMITGEENSKHFLSSKKLKVKRKIPLTIGLSVYQMEREGE